MVLTDKYISKQITRLYFNASWRSPKNFILAFLGPIGTVLTNVCVPYFSSRALSSILQNSNNFRMNMVYLVIAAALGTLANRVGFINLMQLQATTMDYLHRLVFERLLRRGIAFHTNNIGGKLVSDAQDFVSGYSVLMMAAVNNGFGFILMLISGLLIVSVNTWQLGLFLFITVLITLVWAYFESNRRMNVRTKRLIASKNLTGHLSDSIVNAQTVKMFAHEELELKENAKLNKLLSNLRHKDWTHAGRSGNDRAAFLLMMIIFLLLFINKEASTHPEILGTGIFAFTYSFSLLLRLYDINNLTRQVEESYLQASPVMKMLLEKDEIVDGAKAEQLVVAQGEIEIKNVNFHYLEKSGDQTVFENLNLTIKSGESVGLIGPSGGGKTTLTRLLLRFDDVQKGSIEIDGQKINEVTQTSLRSAIAYVPQEPLLFHRSILENISYGKPDAVQDEIIAAAKLANAHKFISELSGGYSTIVGERGVKLSGGQRQRVAIARALLKDAPILVLDEATSALDSESEKAIQDALLHLLNNRTSIVVAHRLSTIQRMDRIVVLDKGKIVEEGSHSELLKQNGLYAKLWNHQTGGFIEE